MWIGCATDKTKILVFHIFNFNRGRIEVLNMIKFRNKIFPEYFIDPETAIITNSKGEIQTTKIRDLRPYFKGMAIHEIQAHTKYGYKKGLVVHHLDHNKINNSLSNLVYITQSEHTSIHNKVMSEATKRKISAANKGENHPMYGKHLSEETKQKQSDSLKGHKVSEETKKKIGDAKKGNTYMLGKKLTEDAKRKISESHIGEKNPMYGKKYKWINNGVEEKFIQLDEDIPSGFHRGRLKK